MEDILTKAENIIKATHKKEIETLLNSDFNLNLAGFPIKVFLRSDEYMAGDCGRWYPNKRMIFINENMDLLARWETLWHEIQHAISDTYRLDLTESQVHTLSIACFNILRDNPIILEELKNIERKEKNASL